MQEAKVLRRLAKLHISAGYVPQLLYTGQFHGSELLVQSALSKKTHRGPERLDIRHIEFLAEIFNQTSIQEAFLESEYWSCARKDVDALQGRISDDWQQRLQRGLDICKALLTDKTMPLGLCHCDFVPWNTHVERGHLYIFDWEYAIEHSIPFWDIFHFVTFPAMLVYRSSGKEVINFWRGRKLRELLILYADKAGVDVALPPICFLLYLTDLCCFYLDMFTRDGLWDKQRQWLEKTWAEMLDELTTHWEVYWGQWQ